MTKGFPCNNPGSFVRCSLLLAVKLVMRSWAVVGGGAVGLVVVDCCLLSVGCWGRGLFGSGYR